MLHRLWLRSLSIQNLFRFTVWVALLGMVACSQAPAPALLTGKTMGTTYHIKITVTSAAEREKALALQADIDQHLQDFNQCASTYIADSEIQRVSQAPTGVWLDVSERFFAILALSQEISALSDGAFDVTVAPLVNAWGFGPDWQQDNTPSGELLAALRDQVGYTYLELDASLRRVKKQRPVQLDFSAVAKGYGVDEIAALIEQAGFKHYMVEIGGELRLKGENPAGKPWRIGVESPKPNGKPIPINVTDIGVATSGDYRNFFEKDGVRYSHTIDPSTGKPVRHTLASVTVLAPTSAKADALATAFSVLGADKALEMAERYRWPIYLIEYDNEQLRSRHSTAFAPYLVDQPN
jgi:FAD:protein FMN transferase